jgi:glycosyltransferase involved in cell wall biosynthesis
MRILFLTARFHPQIGGVEKHVLRVSEELIKKGNKVSVLTEIPAGVNRRKIKNYHSLDKSDTHGIKAKETAKSIYSYHSRFKNIEVYRLYFGEFGWSKKFKIWREILKNLSLIKNADVIHCHDVFIWILPFRFLFPTKKIYVTFHGYETYPIKIKEIIIRKISELLSNGNICVGNFMKKWYFTKPDAVIYGGVDITKVKKDIKEPKALFFGRIDDQTGIMTYVRAEKLIKDKVPDFRLDIFGEGELKRKIRRRINKFDPFIAREIPSYRYIFVSRYLSILEALACRRMVFAVFDNPVKQDYLNMSPFKKFISISQNEHELARNVLFYYSNQNFEQRVIEKGHEWARHQTWEKIESLH